jgi:hypothetical protein
MPPSTGDVVLVIQLACGKTTKTTSGATLPGSAARPSGMLATGASWTPGVGELALHQLCARRIARAGLQDVERDRQVGGEAQLPLGGGDGRTAA